MNKKEILNIRLDSETKELFKQIAEKNNTSMSKLVEEFIAKEIKKTQQSKKKGIEEIYKKVNDVFNEMSKFNREHGYAQSNQPSKSELYGLIVFDNKSFDKEYPFESRAYYFGNNNKYFLDGMIGNSIFGYSLDGTDMGIRIDEYRRSWVIEDCYLIEFKDNKVYTLDGTYVGETTNK